MRAIEILKAVEPEFPGLTEKTLRDWVKHGLLQEPQKVGRGKDGVIAEWADDCVPRIKLIKTIAGERVNIDKARMVLIANGYFLGADVFTNTVTMMLDSLENRRQHFKTKLRNKRVRDINTIHCMSNTLTLAIVDMMLDLQDVRARGMTPALRLIQMASIESARNVIESFDNDEIAELYAQSSYIYKLFHPVMSYLLGYADEIDETSPMFAGVTLGLIKQSATPSSMEKYEFEYILRMLSMIGVAIIRERWPQIDKEYVCFTTKMQQ